MDEQDRTAAALRGNELARTAPKLWYIVERAKEQHITGKDERIANMQAILRAKLYK